HRGGYLMTFRTALCDLLGIEYPIVQSGMGAIAGPELVAEVCRAGGLGILAGLNVPPDDLRAMIRRVRELTDRPVRVDLWLDRGRRAPPRPGRGEERAPGRRPGDANPLPPESGLPAAGGSPEPTPRPGGAGAPGGPRRAPAGLLGGPRLARAGLRPRVPGAR